MRGGRVGKSERRGERLGKGIRLEERDIYRTREQKGNRRRKWQEMVDRTREQTRGTIERRSKRRKIKVEKEEG